MELTFEQRFDITTNGKTYYAPLTNGCPAMKMAVDRSVFKKTDADKGLLATLKQGIPKSRTHKFVRYILSAF